MNIILIGPPGTGKGTQAECLSAKLKIPHISTGEMFRQAAQDGSKLGIGARDKYWGKGNLVPDDITVGLVKERLKKADCKNGYILDGFPRTIPQAKALDKISNVEKVFSIETREITIIKRLTNRRQCSKCKKIYGIDLPPKKEGVCDACGGKLILRDDDKEEVIKERLQVYEQQTKPLINYYTKQYKIYPVDGEQPIDALLKQIIKITSKQ